MGRRKIVIKHIPDARVRQVTFMKRKNGLIKKAMELSMLCDCQVSLVIFTSDGQLHEYSSVPFIKNVMRYLEYAKEHESWKNSDYEQFETKKPVSQKRPAMMDPAMHYQLIQQMRMYIPQLHAMAAHQQHQLGIISPNSLSSGSGISPGIVPGAYFGSPGGRGAQMQSPGSTSSTSDEPGSAHKQLSVFSPSSSWKNAPWASNSPDSPNRNRNRNPPTPSSSAANKSLPFGSSSSSSSPKPLSITIPEGGEFAHSKLGANTAGAQSTLGFGTMAGAGAGAGAGGGIFSPATASTTIKWGDTPFSTVPLPSPFNRAGPGSSVISGSSLLHPGITPQGIGGVGAEFTSPSNWPGTPWRYGLTTPGGFVGRVGGGSALSPLPLGGFTPQTHTQHGTSSEKTPRSQGSASSATTSTKSSSSSSSGTGGGGSGGGSGGGGGVVKNETDSPLPILQLPASPSPVDSPSNTVVSPNNTRATRGFGRRSESPKSSKRPSRKRVRTGG